MEVSSKYTHQPSLVLEDNVICYQHKHISLKVNSRCILYIIAENQIFMQTIIFFFDLFTNNTTNNICQSEISDYGLLIPEFCRGHILILRSNFGKLQCEKSYNYSPNKISKKYPPCLQIHIFVPTLILEYYMMGLHPSF